MSKSKSTSPTFNFTKVLLSVKASHNSHLQTEVSGKTITLEHCITMCKDLEALEPTCSFVCEVWTDGGISIYQKDFWEEGEHPMGHRDRLILSVGGE